MPRFVKVSSKIGLKISFSSYHGNAGALRIFYSQFRLYTAYFIVILLQIGIELFLFVLFKRICLLIAVIRHLYE